jgi:hypothetical protein
MTREEPSCFRDALLCERRCGRRRVLIVGHAHTGDREGVIDHARYRGPSVEASLVLSDGSPAVARMDAEDWDWLELRAGDIVSVCLPLEAPVSV